MGIVKIPTEEIYHDDAINNSESITVGIDRKEVLIRLQTVFAREFQRYSKLKESANRPTDYATRQVWRRIKKQIKFDS